MTDETITQDPPAGAVADLFTPEQSQAMAAELIRHGMDPGRVNAALRGDSAPVEADGDGPGIPEPSNTKTPPLTDAQAMELADALLAAGVPEEEIRAALEADGYEAELVEVEEPSEEERQFRETFGAPADPSEYRIDYLGRLPVGTDVSTLAEFDREAKAWLSGVGFPPQIGPAVIERAVDVGQRYNRMSEPQRQLWVREQNALFERMAGGPEQASAKLAAAAAALANAPAAFTEALHKSGTFHDAGVMMHLANQGERLAPLRA